MPRHITTVRPARGPEGQRLYRPNAISDCPVHKYCAYDGMEKDRCSECHVHLAVGCIHNFGGIPAGSRACGCRACGEAFGSNTAFDRHRIGFNCKEPSSIGLVLAARAGGWLVWVGAGERPELP